jgi:hypothetical protein
LLYALALIFAYVVLTGRRLGRPLRTIPERGRSLAEYVISMAAIFRRAGLRSRVLALWQADLRRDLAGPGGVRGRTDADLVAEAARRADLTPEEQDEALTLLRAREAATCEARRPARAGRSVAPLRGLRPRVGEAHEAGGHAWRGSATRRGGLGEGALVELCARIAHLQRRLSPRR